MAAPKQTDPQFKLRMPQKLKDDLEDAVEASGRSLNAEIVWRLERSFASLNPDDAWHEIQSGRIEDLEAELKRVADALSAFAAAVRRKDPIVEDLPSLVLKTEPVPQSPTGKKRGKP